MNRRGSARRHARKDRRQARLPDPRLVRAGGLGAIERLIGRLVQLLRRDPVLGVERDRVKLGIAAPADVSVLREELVEDAEQRVPTPLHRRPAKPTYVASNGNLALKPDSKP